MNAKDNLREAAKKLPQKRVAEQEPVAEETKNQVRQTLYLPTEIHDQIRDAAHVKRCSQQEIFRQALDLWFANEGLPSWDELKKPKS